MTRQTAFASSPTVNRVKSHNGRPVDKINPLKLLAAIAVLGLSVANCEPTTPPDAPFIEAFVGPPSASFYDPVWLAWSGLSGTDTAFIAGPNDLEYGVIETSGLVLVVPPNGDFTYTLTAMFASGTTATASFAVAGPGSATTRFNCPTSDLGLTYEDLGWSYNGAASQFDVTIDSLCASGNGPFSLHQIVAQLSIAHEGGLPGTAFQRDWNYLAQQTGDPLPYNQSIGSIPTWMVDTILALEVS